MSVLLALVLALVPACASEDSPPAPGQLVCGWDASTQGNGLGRSFLATAEGLYYLPGQ